MEAVKQAAARGLTQRALLTYKTTFFLSGCYSKKIEEIMLSVGGFIQLPVGTGE